MIGARVVIGMGALVTVLMMAAGGCSSPDATVVLPGAVGGSVSVDMSSATGSGSAVAWSTGAAPSVIQPVGGGCAPSQLACGGVCVNPLDDNLNCGACAMACAAGSLCQAGQCLCAPGLTNCGGQCVDLTVDPVHCGACYQSCQVGLACSSGQCGSCAPGQQACAGVCTDILSNPSNCGGCGIVCGVGQACTGGVCAGGGFVTGTGGGSGTGGSPGTGGNATGGDATGGMGTGGMGTGGQTACTDEETKFSFFCASLEGLRRESGSADGFGGDLGGLTGADAICQRIAEYSTPCAANRQWRAFLSTTAGPVHAKDRIGPGPWYDRVGRVIAMNLTDLINERPIGTDPAIANDLPNEYGVPNHDPDGTGEVDNHDFLTGTDDQGMLYDTDPALTCSDWTSAEPEGSPRCGHPWPTATGSWGGGELSNWMSAITEAGCAPADTATSLIESGPPNERNPTVGSGGGYGGFYCFALAL